MEKWLKTGTLKRSASRTEIRTTDLAAMEITVDQQDDSHEVQRPTDWPVQSTSGARFSSDDEVEETRRKCLKGQGSQMNKLILQSDASIDLAVT
ncbi:hypothetical protein AVEN_164806-1 [Araneus ventricosus]|uniref:Uncharacterized protein n=1 Tax=Araneus ventricosus TaxID=182803 RepID=A0A4Y2BYX0_ARAVE|nr:hypothetical protein AVEN_164806-1 [Araneus ventricosus]